MTQHELECAVARSTGESLREIRRRGFNLASPYYEPIVNEEPDDSLPKAIDWDELEHVEPPRHVRRRRMAVV
ncbi:MAG: hypothetical protein AB7F89_17950 [Pirellulaceae bacterium]